MTEPAAPSRATAGLFWVSVMAMPAASLLVVTALASRLVDGELAEVSVVFGLSLIGTVVAIGVQARAAADTVNEGGAGRLARRPLIAACIGFALVSLPVALALDVPVGVVLLPALGLGPGMAVGAVRGELIGRREFRAVATNNSIEALTRLVTGIGLGLFLGPTGVAVSLTLSPIAAWFAAPRGEVGRRDVTLSLPSAVVAAGALMVAVQMDVLLGPRILGPLADGFAAASLPSKGVYMALSAMAWIAVPGALERSSVRAAFRPLVVVAGLGVALTAATVALAGPIGAILSTDRPPAGLLALLGLSMTAAGGSWLLLQVRLTRGARGVWAPPLIPAVVILAGAPFVDTEVGLASLSLAAQVSGLLAGVGALAVELRHGAVGRPDPEASSTPTPAPVVAALRPGPSVEGPIVSALRDGPIPGDPRTPRWSLFALGGVLLLQVLLQRWGRIAQDTRLDLLLAPADYLSRAWTMWDATTYMGRVRNQTVGYLFPMGPAFLAGKAAEIEPWLVGRLWIALLLVMAMWGMARMLDALAVGSAPTRLVAAAAYALSPFMLARVGGTSSFVLGAALLPWVMVALVRGSSGGSPRRAAALAGVGVVAMGGINAAVTLSVLVAPVIWLATRSPGPRRRRLVRWSVLALGLATVWWAVPLVLQGRYGSSFLHYTESARVTTYFNSPFEVIRGMADWLSYYRLDQVTNAAGSLEVSSAVVILATGLIAAGGLFGLARRDMPERRFLVITLLVGAAVIGAGHGGTFGNPLARTVRTLLDGPLGAFRTVYKFQPVVLLVLTVGLAHAISVVGRAAARRSPRGRSAVVVGAIVLVVAGAWPLVRGDLVNQRAFEEVPGWWVQAAEVVEATPGRAMLVPGLSHADFYWGYTAQEPFEWFESGEWTVRNLSFLASDGAVTVMDSVQEALARGGDPALAGYLLDAGFSQVVVRNDGRWTSDESPTPQALNGAMLASGLEPEASFGPEILFASESGSADLALHPVEIYRVPGSESFSWVEAVAADDTLVVSGDASAPLEMAAAGLPSRPAILAQDLTADLPDPAAWVVTDRNQRRFTSFGRVFANEGPVLTATASGPGGAPAEDGLTVGAQVEDQTVAVLEGVESISASSYGSLFRPVPAVAPAKAFDGLTATSWVSAAYVDPVGEWLQVDLGEPVDLDSIGVRLLDDGGWRPLITAIDVTTEQGTLRTETVPGEDPQELPVLGGPTRWVRLEVASVEARGSTGAGAGIREVVLPRLEIDQRLAVPDQLDWSSDASSLLPAYVFQRSSANPTSLLAADEETEINRRFFLPRDGELGAAMTVSAVPGPEVLDLLTEGEVVQVTASSTLGDLPGYGPRNLVDGLDESIWVSRGSPRGRAAVSTSDDTTDPDGTSAAVELVPLVGEDEAPTITMEWGGSQTIEALRIVPVPGYSAPANVRIETPDGQVRTGDVFFDGWVRFEPVDASEITLSFPRVLRYALTTGLSEPRDRPLALASVEIPEIEDLYPGPLDEDAPVSLPCGEGPSVTIGAEGRRFSVDATVGDLVSFRPVEATPCDGPFALSEGAQDLDTSSVGSPFKARTVTLVNERTAAALDAPVAIRAVSAASWEHDRRVVDVEPGEAAYLVIPESANPGWRAELDGEVLPAVTIDGWKQGYLLPEGPGGAVTLTYAPTTVHRTGLVVGAGLVLVLLVLALAPARGSYPPSAGARRVPAVVRWAVAVVALFSLGGLAGVAILAVLWALRARWPSGAQWWASGAFAAAALFVAVTQESFPDDLVGAFGVPATVATLFAVAAVASSILPTLRASSLPWSSGPPDPADGEPWVEARVDD